ncbi:MAG: SUF system NifU family Fe-S cluster assembly protein [Rhodospirillales bacterium]|nr:SUF system NifU family Fe-S cluster assembly protein [Rhodospirillales bacterium]
MSSELRELYQEVILDHGRTPRNFGKPNAANHHAHGHNPLCGDKVTVYLEVDGGLVKDVGFEGSGCAISMASTSLMTETLKGRSVEEAHTFFRRFHDLMTGSEDGAGEEVDEDAFERLMVLSGVREFPMRVKCATLCWHTMEAAVKGEADILTE